MGRASFLLVGRSDSMEKSFGTACHGAGRLMSRRKAKEFVKEQGLEKVIKDMVVVARGKGTIMDTGSIKAQEAARAVGTISSSGGIPKPCAVDRRMGAKMAVVAVLLISSVMNIMNKTEKRIIKKGLSPPRISATVSERY